MMSVSERTSSASPGATWAAAIALLATGVGMLLVVHYRFPGVPAYDYWREIDHHPGGVRHPGAGDRHPAAPAPGRLAAHGLGVIGSMQLVAGQYAALAGAADLPGRLYGMWASSLAQSPGLA